ncbi:hypothetical protein RvY_06628 [Ramazzottius varieornatus]|uniref:Uncharacterized protein n=1 Tax=Ramazzottius varieornatus TaxID=947166 RepID=A0A1D1V255_RAMVA|nr:hypothetical protein RvY_06628 [Ramazzottius varieornatus]
MVIRASMGPGSPPPNIVWSAITAAPASSAPQPCHEGGRSRLWSTLLVCCPKPIKNTSNRLKLIRTLRVAVTEAGMKWFAHAWAWHLITTFKHPRHGRWDLFLDYCSCATSCHDDYCLCQSERLFQRGEFEGRNSKKIKEYRLFLDPTAAH